MEKSVTINFVRNIDYSELMGITEELEASNLLLTLDINQITPNLGALNTMNVNPGDVFGVLLSTTNSEIGNYASNDLNFFQFMEYGAELVTQG